MPGVSAFIDSMRAAFGTAEVDGWIRDGLRQRKGAGFYARENEQEVGQRIEGGGHGTR